MVVAHFQNFNSKKLGFNCSLVVVKTHRAFLVTIWSAKGVFGSTNFLTKSQALGFCQFLGAKTLGKTHKQLSLFNLKTR
jgi:hypothetical protein